jgi:hypothetical protein
MKTTVDLPDDLMRAVNLRAVHEDRRIKDVVAELLRRGLAAEPAGVTGVSRRVELPLVRTAHRATPETEMTAERVAAVLLDDEVRSVAPE